MMDTRNPLQPVHSRIFLAREGPSFVLLLSHKRPCHILVLTASWDLLIIITLGKAQYLGRFWESRGVHSEYNWIQTRANEHPAQSQTMGYRDCGSDLLRRGPTVVPVRRLSSRQRARERDTPLCTSSPVYTPAEDDHKFRDRTVVYSTVCGTTPRRRQQIPWRIRYRNT
jgi:hypothetical protein